MSVNASARELGSHDIVEHVRRTLAETGALPSLLRLEVSERALADLRAEAAVKALRATECDFAQGFLVSVPLDAEQARWMKARDLPA